ncbi:hypothetical protein GCM10027029_15000 [Conyzicola lurida]
MREEKVCFHGGGEVSWVSGSVGGKPTLVAVVTYVLDLVAYGRIRAAHSTVASAALIAIVNCGYNWHYVFE